MRLDSLLKNRTFLSILILLDISMAASATYVDFEHFLAAPWFLVLFVPICPIYPLLLAVNFWKFWRSGEFSQPLLHFTLIGAISYGFMAYIFYPTYLITNGFAWFEIGNILWVSMYASQSLFLFSFLKKIPAQWYLLFLSYFFLKDFLDRFSVTFSYHRFGVFSTAVENFLFTMILLFHTGVSFLVSHHSILRKTYAQFVSAARARVLPARRSPP